MSADYQRARRHTLDTLNRAGQWREYGYEPEAIIAQLRDCLADTDAIAWYMYRQLDAIRHNIATDLPLKRRMELVANTVRKENGE